MLIFRDTNILIPPLRLGDVPEELQTDDGVDQRVVLDSLRESAGDFNASSVHYEDMPVASVLLSQFRRMYETRSAKAAFDLLRSRTEIEIDPEDQYTAVGSDLIFDISHHFLDFLLVLSKGIGFHAFLPNSPSDHLFIFSLDLHQPCRILKTKHVELGFSLFQRALYIGTSRGKDTAWLVMVPDSFINAQDDGIPEDNEQEEDEDHADPQLSRGRAQTNMQSKHYFMLVMYIAFVFEKYLPGRNIACYKDYPDLTTNTYKNVKAATNLL